MSDAVPTTPPPPPETAEAPQNKPKGDPNAPIGSPEFQEAFFEAMAARIVEVGDTATVKMPTMALVVLIGQVQLALRHPENEGPAATAARGIITKMINNLAGDNPVLRRGLEQGFWIDAAEAEEPEAAEAATPQP